MEQNIEFELACAVNFNTNSKNEIVNFYTDYINNLIKTKYKDTNIEYNELLNIGLLALLETIKAKDIDHKKIINCIKKDINTFIKKEKQFNNSKTIPDTYIDSSLENIDTTIDIKNAINTLSEKYKNIIYLYFYQNYTLEEIGKIYSVSRERIRQLISNGLEKISKVLNQRIITPNKKNNIEERKNDNKSIPLKQDTRKQKLIINFALQKLKVILFNYDNDEIENALKKLETQDLDTLENILSNFNVLNDELNIPLIQKIKNLIIEEKIINRNFNLYDFFPKHSKIKVDAAICLLPKNDKILIEYFIKNNNIFYKIIDTNIELEINQIVFKITKILQNKHYITTLRTNFIYKKFYNYSEEEIDFIFSLLNNNDKAVLNLYYLTKSSEINSEIQRIFDEMEQNIKIFHSIFIDQNNIYNILNQYNRFDIDNILGQLGNTDLRLWNTKCNGDINLGIKKYYIYTDKITKKLEKCKKLEFKHI